MHAHPARAEWNSEGQQEYNPGILDQPAKHQSVLDAEAALAASGSKKVSLQECMEVRGVGTAGSAWAQQAQRGRQERWAQEHKLCAM